MNQSPRKPVSIELDQKDCLELINLLGTYGKNKGKDWDLWASQINQTIQSALDNSHTTPKVPIILDELNWNAINNIIQSVYKDHGGEWPQWSQNICQIINDATQKVIKPPPLPLTPPAQIGNDTVNSQLAQEPQPESGRPGTKKCPFCAEEIQAAAVVCKHCGRELAPLPKSAAVDYEYMEFENAWPEEKREWRFSWGRGVEPSVRLIAWQRSQPEITSKLEALINQGWEPIGEIGPSGVQVTWETGMDSFRHFFRGVSKYDYQASKNKAAYSTRSTVLILICIVPAAPTAFISLIPMLMHIFTGYCAPEKFKLKLRRAKSAVITNTSM
jgi:hypothetical protein